MAQLSDIEIDILNKIIPTQTFSETQNLQRALREIINEHKESLMAQGAMTEGGYKEFQTQSVKNIFDFLLKNAFIAEREGHVFFLTEKGKNLRRQKSLQQYVEWARQQRAENKVIMHTIETRGYLDQDEIDRRGPTLVQKLKKYVLFPVLIIIVLVLAYVVSKALHYI